MIHLPIVGIVLRPTHLSGGLGIGLMVGLGAAMFCIAQVVRHYLVRTTHDFIIAQRRIGLGFGVGSVISVWTWSMAVMLSSASAFTWGTAGLLWFIVPNGLAVVLMVPFAVWMRKRMPAGYTLVQFIRERFHNPVVTVAMFVGLVFLLLGVVMINMAGVWLVIGSIFHLKQTVVLILTIAIVGIYSYFGGLWTSTITATLGALMVSTPAAIAVLYALYKVGGPNLVFSRVQHLHPSGGPPYWMWRWDTASTFGISLGLGLLANTICDQSFWQRVWGMRPQNLARTFVWAGWWFYPIPLTLGLLGLIALGAGVQPSELGAFGPGAAGPYIMSHLGLPVVIICVYVLTVITACFSATDGAFSGISALTAIDLVKRFNPDIREKSLFRLTKLSIPIAGIIGMIVVSSGIDYVNLVNIIYFIDIGLALPLAFALFWRRYSAAAFVASLVVSEAAGIPVRQTVGALDGIIVLIGASALVSVVVSLLGNERFDFSRLATPDELLPEVQEAMEEGVDAARAPVGRAEAPTGGVPDIISE